MGDKLINWLENEIERHKEKENAEATSWGRGFENGSLTEAILLRNKVREFMIHEQGV